MMEEERNRGYPLESLQLTISPSEYDVLITDISEGDIQKIGEILRVQHLSPASADPVFPVDGIIYGQNLRIFVPLVVKIRQTSINVNFLFNTASPNSYLRKETFEALGFHENIPSEVVLKIHGFSMPVHLSRGHFENVDMIGQDFLRQVGICATLNYNDLVVKFSNDK